MGGVLRFLALGLLFILIATKSRSVTKSSRSPNRTSSYGVPSNRDDQSGNPLGAATDQGGSAGRERQGHEQRSWERQISVAKSLNWITAVAAILNLLGLVILYETLGTTKIAALAARDQANAALGANKISERLYISGERPWVYLDQVKFIFPIRIDNAVNAGVRFVFKNIGHSPAINVWVEPKLMLLNSWKAPVRWPIDAQREICDALISKSPNTGPVVFPNRDGFVDYGLATSAEELADSRANPGSKALMPYLVGCIDYRFTFAPEHHQTGFIFAITRKARDGTGPLLNTEPGSIEPDDVILDPTFSGGIRID
jgi:hypothetical protein